MNLLQPVIERLWVKPDELRVEEPYLARNIEMTRRAYQLDGVDVKPFAGLGQLTPASLTQDSATVKNIRLVGSAAADCDLQATAGNPPLLRFSRR